LEPKKEQYDETSTQAPGTINKVFSNVKFIAIAIPWKI